MTFMTNERIKLLKNNAHIAVSKTALAKMCGWDGRQALGKMNAFLRRHNLRVDTTFSVVDCTPLSVQNKKIDLTDIPTVIEG